MSPQDVVNAYRWLLGRHPSEREVSLWLHVRSADQLRQIFMQSGEFIGKVSKLLPPPSDLWIAPPLPSSNDVEWQCDAASDARLLQYIQETWNSIGQERPHWSVLSDERYSPERFDAHSAEFYKSGEGDLQLILNILRNNNIDVGGLGSVVEYGCGVGRVTPHLAARFAHVTAIDISESHLALARQNCARHHNVSFVMSRLPEFGMVSECDLWFSKLVLQHNPPPIIARILLRAFDLLAPDGTAIFQVTTWCNNYRFLVSDYLASRPSEPAIEVHCLPQRVIFDLGRQAGCFPLEVRKDGAMGPPAAWASHTFVFRKSAG